MVVVYYTHTYYLDAALETFQSIKNEVELHIVIELSPESKKSTIIDIDDLDGLNHIESCEKVLGKEKWQELEKYFEGVASVSFVVHKFKRSFSFAALKVARILGKHLKKLKADVIHFDTISSRAIGLFPFIRKKRVFITVHDPVPHSGEGSWKTRIPQLVFFRITKGFFFYSEFASSQFKKYYSEVVATRNVLSFQPFSFIKQFIPKEPVVTERKPILFFGRISLYKGVDLLLGAIPTVLEKYPDEKFMIAGNPFEFEIDMDFVGKYKNNIDLLIKYISTDELARLVSSAKFVVCPYRDATQSGVLMTTYALGKMAIASNIGAFPEYIDDNVNGLLTEPDSASIAAKIIAALDNDRYKELEKNVTSSYSASIGQKNRDCLLNAYKGM